MLAATKLETDGYSDSEQNYFESLNYGVWNCEPVNTVSDLTSRGLSKTSRQMGQMTKSWSTVSGKKRSVSIPISEFSKRSKII